MSTIEPRELTDQCNGGADCPLGAHAENYPGWHYRSDCPCRGSGHRVTASGDIGYCSLCNGNGTYWVTPRGRHVAYPGGPFL